MRCCEQCYRGVLARMRTTWNFFGVASLKKKMTTYLLSKHIRSGGDDTRCACPICCVDLTLREESFAEWMQCPSCKTVGHSSCIKRCVLASDDAFLCPVCRTSYDTEYMVSDPSAWSAVDLQQRLKSERDDQEYVNASPTVGSSDRRLRSRGPVQESRKLRSRSVVI